VAGSAHLAKCGVGVHSAGQDQDADQGLSFQGGIAHLAWSGNSNSTGTNPDGALHQLDIYTAAVPAP
jgi:hypothetical protein